MRTAIKFIGGILLLLIVLFIITAIVLTNVVNPNDYKDRIDQYVYQQTGRHLTIKGNVGWSFVPWLGVDLKQVQLSNPKGFSGPALANLGEMKISMRFWPLLVGKVQLGKIVISNTHINLITNTQNQTNWGDWSKTSVPKKTTAPTQKGSTHAPVTSIEIIMTPTF